MLEIVLVLHSIFHAVVVVVVVEAQRGQAQACAFLKHTRALFHN